LQLEIFYRDHQREQRGLALPEPADLVEILSPAAERLLKRAWTRRVNLQRLRLRAGRLYPRSEQLCWWDVDRTRSRQLACAEDGIRLRFGPGALIRGCRLSMLKNESAPLKDGAKTFTVG